MAKELEAPGLPPDLPPDLAGVEADTAEYADPLAAEDRESANFFMLLHALTRAESSAMPADEFRRLTDAVRRKIDGIKLRLTKLEAEAARLKEIEGQFSAARRGVEANGKRLEEWAKYCMLHHKIPFLAGEKFSFRLQDADGKVAFDPGHEDPTARDALLFPRWVKRSYAWDKEGLRKAYLAGEKELPAFARVGKTKKFSMTVTKKEK